MYRLKALSIGLVLAAAACTPSAAAPGWTFSPAAPAAAATTTPGGNGAARLRDGQIVPLDDQRAVLRVAVLGTALAYMSDDMLNLAMPSLARDLAATVTDAQWIPTPITWRSSHACSRPAQSATS